MTTSYSAKDVNVIFGVLPLLGEGDGDFVTVAPMAEGSTMVVGARGHTVVIDEHNDAIEITVRLAAIGDGRNTLSALVTHHTAGNQYLPIAMNSLSTGETVIGGAAKLKRKPELAFGSGSPTREVTFLVPNAKMIVTPET